MKRWWIVGLMFVVGVCSHGQTQPTRVLVFMHTWTDYIDGTWWETLHDVSMGPRPSAQMACMRSHADFCKQSYLDLYVSPQDGLKPEVLKLLKASAICRFEQSDLDEALKSAEFRATSTGGGGWRFLAICNGQQKDLQIPDWDAVDKKKLRRVSARAFALFSFAQALTAGYNQKESHCPEEWRKTAGEYLNTLLDNEHRKVLERSTALHRLEAGHVNGPLRGTYRYSFEIDPKPTQGEFDEPKFDPDMPEVTQATVRGVLQIDPSTDKVTGVQRTDSERDLGSFIFFRSFGRQASEWEFAPGSPAAIPFIATFRCSQ